MIRLGLKKKNKVKLKISLKSKPSEADSGSTHVAQLKARKKK